MHIAFCLRSAIIQGINLRHAHFMTAEHALQAIPQGRVNTAFRLALHKLLACCFGCLRQHAHDKPQRVGQDPKLKGFTFRSALSMLLAIWPTTPPASMPAQRSV